MNVRYIILDDDDTLFDPYDSVFEVEIDSISYYPGDTIDEPGDTIDEETLEIRLKVVK